MQPSTDFIDRRRELALVLLWRRHRLYRGLGATYPNLHRASTWIDRLRSRIAYGQLARAVRGYSGQVLDLVIDRLRHELFR